MRSRNIKPGFFKNEFLGELDPIVRLLFIGLWCLADKEGRLEDRPKKIKIEVLPYDDCNVEDMLASLVFKNFITRYFCDGAGFIQINNFLRHQHPHYKEEPSRIPPPPEQSYACPKLDPSMDQEQAKFDPSMDQPPPDRQVPARLIPDSLLLITRENTSYSSCPAACQPPDPNQAPKCDSVLKIPLAGKHDSHPVFEIQQKDIDTWQESFPGMDVMQSIRVCRQWNIDNPERRKTKTGIRRHVSGWLERDYNKGLYRKNGREPCRPSSSTETEWQRKQRAERDQVELYQALQAKRREIEEDKVEDDTAAHDHCRAIK